MILEFILKYFFHIVIVCSLISIILGLTSQNEIDIGDWTHKILTTERSDVMKTGKILARLRDEEGTSQKRLAERMNTSTSKVSRMEAETVPLSETEITQYLKALETPQAGEFLKYLPQKTSILR